MSLGSDVFPVVAGRSLEPWNTTTPGSPSDPSLPTTRDIWRSDLFKWYGTLLLFIPLLICIGVPGNALVLHVYRTRWPSCTYSLFVRVLACLDLGNCLVTMPLMLIHFVVWSRPDSVGYVNRELARAPRYFAYALTFASGAILLVISIDRYLKICWPTKRGIDARLARRLCVGLCLACFVLTIPAPLSTRGFLFGGSTGSGTDVNATNTSTISSLNPLFSDIPSGNGTRDFMVRHITNKGDATDGVRDTEMSNSSTMTSTSPESQASSAAFIKKLYLTCIFVMFGLSFLAIVVMYTLVWRTLKTRKHVLRKCTRRDSRAAMERTAARSARIFSVVTCAFVLLHLPHFIVLVLYVLDKRLQEEVGHVGKAFLNLAELSPFINSVVNPLIYSFTSPRFRRESHDVVSRYCCCCLGRLKLFRTSMWSSQKHKSELVTEEVKQSPT